MAQIFPKWTNQVPRKILIGLIVVANALIFSVWYFFSPSYTDVGYAPSNRFLIVTNYMLINLDWIANTAIPMYLIPNRQIFRQLKLV